MGRIFIQRSATGHSLPDRRKTMSIRTKRRRDNQQWLLDLAVKTSGRIQNFAYDQRTLPKEVKSYRMIHRVLEKYGRHMETLASEAEKAGHPESACEMYWHACERYREAQHAIFEDDHPEKIYLHGKLLACFERVMELSGTGTERVEIPFEGDYIQAVLYLAQDERRAPTVLFVPGMDATKESNPINHPFAARGMHCLHIDGPGQGTSNMRKIRIGVDNYERAGQAAIDYLCSRPEVDADRIAVAGSSMGSYWGMRIAATDSRVKAIATSAACYSGKRAIFEEASPRFKQVFMYMAGIDNEDEFDALAERMTLDGMAARITCPSLMVVGEYDPLAHLEDVLDVYRQVPAPKELWVVEDDFHQPRGVENVGGIDSLAFQADWIRDALNGRKPSGLDRIVLVDKMGKGQYSDPIKGVYLPERRNEPPATLTEAQLGPAGSQRLDAAMSSD
jgi:pimeloyl-ACP methyl ester carboxylesterase